MQTILVFVLVTASSFSGVIGAGPGDDVPLWARWLEPFVGPRREGRQSSIDFPSMGSSEDTTGLENRWQQFGNQWQQPFNPWQQQFGQNNHRPNEFGENPDPNESNEDRFGQNQRPNQFGQNQRPNQFGQNQRPNQFGQNQYGPNQPNQFGQNQRPPQFGQNQFGQNQFGQNQFGQNQRPTQFGQNQRPNQSGQNQNQRPNQSGLNQNQRPNQSGQNHNQRPNQSGQNHNQRPNQSGQNQNQRPNQSGQNQNQRPNLSGQNQNQRPNQRPNEQEYGESNQRPSQFGQSQQGSQEVEEQPSRPMQPGDSCRRDNKVGKCTRIYQCQEVLQMIQQNRRPPPPCYIPPNDSTPYVCCLDKDTSTPKPKPPNPTQPTKPRPQPVTERVAKQKCKEYARHVFEKVESPALFESAPIEVDRCVKSAEGLIVGGVDAALGEFPHMALLGYGDNPDAPSWECGGSLISEDYVLTAAHCVAEKTPITVLLGDLILGDDTDHARPQSIPITSDRDIIPHPDYRFPSNYFDVALIRLSRRPTIGPNVRPACLHTGESFQAGSLIASGWGRTDFGGEPSDILMKVSLNEVAFDLCNRTYRNMGNKLIDGIRNNQQLCAGRLEGGKDTCQGDSGGPLQVFRSNPHCTYDIIGVVSFGKGCALRNTPGVYARVQFFLDWIERIVWPNNAG